MCVFLCVGPYYLNFITCINREVYEKERQIYVETWEACHREVKGVKVQRPLVVGRKQRYSN